MVRVQTLFDENNIDENKGSFSDFFKLVDKAEHEEVSQDEYIQSGNRVLY